MNDDQINTEKEGEHSHLARQATQPGEPTPANPSLSWDIGTAYDLFFSLHVLHMPEKFGLRASWAAGVRSRMSNDEREILLKAQNAFYVPLCWIYTLPAPKDAESALWALRQMAPEERLLALTFCPETSDAYRDIFTSVASRGAWEESDLEALKDHYREYGKEPPRAKELKGKLEAWTNPAQFGERYLSALQSYQSSFFAEEQRRISDDLRVCLQRAQGLAETVSVSDMIEDLSRGIHFDEYFDVSELILVPSYWITPLIYFSKVEEDSMLIVFGARPADTSLVPGEQIPDPVLLGLKALSDPTRLRILRYLAHENLTPAELARRLRLRAPTVTHHLRSLRLAGLVHVTVGTKHESRYTARLESIDELCTQINGFMASDLEISEA